MTERKREHKSFPVFITKVDAAQGVVESIVAVMGNVDLGTDRIKKGAFTKTIQERAGKIRVLDAHNTDSIMRVLGKPLDMRELGRAELPSELLQKYPDATGGLWTQTQFLLDTPEGAGAFARLASGAVSEWSIGFEIPTGGSAYVKEQVDGKSVMVRELNTLILYEYSPVLWGMNSATATVSAKADGGEAVNGNETKEMGPDGRPIQRFGDMLHGSIHAMFTQIADRYYVAGYMSRDERIALSGLIGSALDVLSTGMPENVAMLECNRGYYDDYYLYALAADVESKAGRVLSGSNAARVRTALAELTAVLQAAGLTDDDEEGEKSHRPAAAGPDDAPPTPPTGEAGPDDAPPTNGFDVAEIDIALAELELLEV